MREPDKSRKTTWSRMRAACTALGRDRNGSAFFYVTISLPVLVGFALLAIDGGRLMNLHSHLQHGADGLALAAAGELNRKDDSLERAKRAIEDLIENDQRFGDAGVAVIDDVTARFLTTLPPDDATPISEWIAGDPNRLVAVSTDPDWEEDPRASAARFVEITVNPQGLTTLMPAAFVGASGTAAASADAVAGYVRGACYFTPMMMCNPFEDDDPETPDLYQMAADPKLRRKMIEIRQVGGQGQGSGSYTPGNFGFLRTSLGNGANALRDGLAMVDPGDCRIEDGVRLKTGQNMGKVREGINVRFDIYESLALQSDSNFRPSKNVRKGFGNSCGAAEINDGENFQGLPQDVTLDTTIGSGARIHTGEWDGLAAVEGVHPGGFEGYWHINFGHAGIPVPDGWDNSDENRPSRYEVYRYEIDTKVPENPLDPDSDLVPLYTKASKGNMSGGETGEPMCYTGNANTLSDEPDRRVLHAAVVNCTAEGPLTGSAQTNIPVYAFAKFFLIRPLEGGADKIDIELVEVVSPPTDYQARDTVQLYR